MIPFLRNRIVARAAPGMAAADALQRKPEALEHTVLSESLQPVLRAGGCVAALRSQQGRNDPLVQLDQCNKRKACYFTKCVHCLESHAIFSGIWPLPH